ncbi:MAG: tryptophan synthase subunit alpha [Candidatus Eisenbacteria bacterium]|nr:tryptophan synthase subunit alpha [Candidatus Eisenbacteria bacterium]
MKIPASSPDSTTGRIAKAFQSARADGRRALVGFLTAGYPHPDAMLPILRTLEEGGADVVELGVPFSDPIADGPTIQATSQAALEAGVTLPWILDLVARFRRESELPIVLMTYLNPLLAYGEERFFAAAAEAGVDGLLASDAPPGERPEFFAGLAAARLDRIVLVAPTTPPERLASIVAAAGGFIYLLTRTGVTGQGAAFAQNLSQRVAELQRLSPLPVAAGFGVRSAADIAELPSELDGVVIGARLLECFLQTADVKAGRAELAAFLNGLRPALRRGAT